MNEFLAALGGALVGAMMVFVAELWRQVLAGKAAARLIRVESNTNAVICDHASQGMYHSELSDTAWRTHCLHVVPLLTADAVNDIADTYSCVPLSQRSMDELRNRPDDPDADGLREGLKAHSKDFDKARFWMFRIEKQGRLGLLVELLSGRRMLPSGEEIDQALANTESGSPKGMS
jgi:hypothetical protein